MITEDNIRSHELIGLQAEISNSTNPQVIGLNGRIIDETKSMLKINTSRGIKSIPKSNNFWRFSIDNSQVVVNGTDLAKRSAERLGGKV